MFEKLRLQIARDARRGGKWNSIICGNANIGVKPVTDPARLRSYHACNAGNVFGRMAYLGRHLWFDSIERSGEYGAGRLPNNAHDRDRNKKPDDRICERESDPNAECAKDNSKRGQTIGAGVVAIGNQGCAIHLTAY